MSMCILFWSVFASHVLCLVSVGSHHFPADDATLVQVYTPPPIPPRTFTRAGVCKKPAMVGVLSNTTTTREIPKQLIITGKQASFDEVTENERANVLHTLLLNPGMKLEYFSDTRCKSFIDENYATTCLPELFTAESNGMYRGDLCRAAVLLKLGGYYTDLDLQFDVPFEKLLSQNTTFASVLTLNRQLLNAFMASTPGNTVMARMVTELENWYDSTEKTMLGTDAGYKALNKLQAEECSEQSLMQLRQGPKACGNEEILMLSEDLCGEVNTPPCPAGRESRWLKYGIYDHRGKVQGWARFQGCSTWGCGGTGHESRSNSSLVAAFNSTGHETRINSSLVAAFNSSLAAAFNSSKEANRSS